MAGCAANAQTNLADDPDIAAYRPRFPSRKPESETKSIVPKTKVFVNPQYDITKKLNLKLDSVFIRNKQIKYADGYRILVFSGTDKTEMNHIKQKVYKMFPYIEVYTVFKQPEYRISFGDFIDKIQAYNYLLKIRLLIPDALLVQDQINIKR